MILFGKVTVLYFLSKFATAQDIFGDVISKLLTSLHFSYAITNNDYKKELTPRKELRYTLKYFLVTIPTLATNLKKILPPNRFCHNKFDTWGSRFHSQVRRVTTNPVQNQSSRATRKKKVPEDLMGITRNFYCKKNYL